MYKLSDIKGFEGLYKIDTDGNVYSRYSNGNKLNPLNHSGGYPYVNLYKNGNAKRYYVHRLVAMTFLKNENLLEQVNHIDGNKKNNNLSNLEWVTSKENCRHAIENGLTSNEKVVSKYSLCGKLLETYKSLRDASLKTSLSYSSIRAAAQGKSKSCGGFLWKYGMETAVDGEGITGIINNKKPVVQKTKDGQVISLFSSIREASNCTGIKYSAISKCVTGVNNTSGGYRWEYALDITKEDE